MTDPIPSRGHAALAGAAAGSVAIGLNELLAALCDRTAFPPLAGHEAADVANGDLRCGEYLK